MEGLSVEDVDVDVDRWAIEAEAEPIETGTLQVSIVAPGWLLVASMTTS